MHSNYTDKKVKETKNCVFFSRKPTMQKCFILPPDARLSAIHSENYTFYKVLLICLVYYFLAIILFSDHCLPCNGRLRVPGVGQRALELDTGAALGEHSQWPLHAETGHWGHDVNMMWACDNVTSYPAQSAARTCWASYSCWSDTRIARCLSASRSWKR